MDQFERMRQEMDDDFKNVQRTSKALLWVMVVVIIAVLSVACYVAIRLVNHFT